MASPLGYDRSREQDKVQAGVEALVLIPEDGPKPLCEANEDIFFGPDDDGRKETGRQQREDLAKAICRECVFRLRCLERAIVHGEDFGVWGGMGEGERREFQAHLKAEGYVREVPTGREMYASVRSFYAKQRKQEGKNRRLA